MKTLIITLFVSFLIAINTAIAQEVKNPPVNIETMFSNNGIHFQTMVQKKLISAPKIGFFALSDILGKWDNTEADGYMVQGKLTYQIVSSLDLLGGFHMASGVGVRPSLGAMYTYANPDFIVVLNPNYNIDDFGNVEGFLMSEFKPKISENWRFYSRVQGLYVHTTEDGSHARSYARLKAGLSYKEFSFGLGANFDYYGPQKINENSLGVFVSTSLF